MTTKRQYQGSLIFDANVLRSAVSILQKRSTKPDGFWMKTLCRVILNCADKMTQEALLLGLRADD